MLLNHMRKRRTAAVRGLLSAGAATGLAAALAAPALAAAPAGPLGSAEALLNPGAAPQVSTTLQAGQGNYEVAVDQARNLAYIAGPDDKAVTVVDMLSERTVATIQLDAKPFGVTVDPLTQTVYTSNTTDSSVSVIDATTNKVTGTIDLEARPHGIEADPLGNRVYVTLPSVKDGEGEDAPKHSEVVVIDGATNSVSAHVRTGKTPVQVGIDPAAGSYWVSTTGDNTLTEYSSATNEEITSIPTGDKPQNFYVDTARGAIYLDDFGSDTVEVIDTRSNSVVDTIEVGPRPIGIDCSPVTQTCAVTHLPDSSKNDDGERVIDPNDPGRVSIIDVAAGTKTGELHVGGVPLGVRYDIVTDSAAVTDRDSGDVTLVHG